MNGMLPACQCFEPVYILTAKIDEVVAGGSDQIGPSLATRFTSPNIDLFSSSGWPEAVQPQH